MGSSWSDLARKVKVSGKFLSPKPPSIVNLFDKFWHRGKTVAKKTHPLLSKTRYNQITLFYGLVELSLTGHGDFQLWGTALSRQSTAAGLKEILYESK